MVKSYEEQVRHMIGAEYVLNRRFPNEESLLVEDAFEAIKRTNAELFKHIPYEVIFTSEDKYTSAKHMREEVTKTGVVYIYDGWSGHPYLTQEENNIGRAVHDVWAHMVCGCPFTFQGEYNAYLVQREYYPEFTWGVLFAEIPAQTAAYYYKGDFSYNQRAFEAPKKWMDWCEPLRKDYSKNSVLKPFFASLAK